MKRRYRMFWVVVFCASQSFCLTAKEVRLTFDHYYDGPAVVQALRDMHAAYPRLTRLESLGQTEEGRDIWLLTVHNQKTGPDTEFPGVYVDGAIHGNEIQATEVCLYLAWYLLSHYQQNEKIKQLVDERSFYIVPVVNVDSRTRYFVDAGNPDIGRTARVAHDDDRDGRKDEDGPDDLDGDGEILQMRVRHPFGKWRNHPDDARVMIPVEPGKPGQWKLLGAEGFDNDGDGRLNEDPPGYLDMNRNYGFHWQPPYVQAGAGDFPNSARATRALSEFIVSKPNICFNFAFHNYGGLFVRGPGSKLAGRYQPEDVKVYDYLGREGEKIVPGYMYVIGMMDMYTTHGDFDQWMFSNLGIFGFVGELFAPDQESYRRPTDDPKPKDGRKRLYGRGPKDIERQKFNDVLTQGEMFRGWKKFQHPDFGEIEIGGWKKFTTRTHQTFLLPEALHRNAALVIFTAGHAPEISLEKISVTKIKKDITRIRIRAANRHALPTMSGMAQRHSLGRQDIFRIQGKGLTVLSGGIIDDLYLDRVAYVDHRPEMIFSTVPSFGYREVQWIVKGRGRVTVTFDSQKARNQKLTLKL